MMKILISAHVRWWNASAYYAVTAAQALARLGHDVTVLAHESTPAYRYASELRLKVIGDINLASTRPISFLKNLGRLRSLLESEKYDILNPHRPEDHFFLAMTNIVSGTRAKLIRTVSDVRSPRDNFLNRILHCKWTDAYIYCARVCMNRYHDVFQLDSSLEKVIYSALDLEEFTAGDWVTDNVYLSHPSPRIGIVARLSPNKGHRVLIEAAAKVIEKVEHASFIVVGKEEEVTVSELREHAQHLGVADFFTFTGRLDDPRPAIAACDIGVIASTESEVISRAAQEFFAFGVPVIATKVNVLPEMVQDGYNGLLIDPGNPDDLADAVIRLCLDDEERRIMSENAATYARERHGMQFFGGVTESFYEAVLRADWIKTGDRK